MQSSAYIQVTKHLKNDSDNNFHINNYWLQLNYPLREVSDFVPSKKLKLKPHHKMWFFYETSPR